MRFLFSAFLVSVAWAQSPTSGRVGVGAVERKLPLAEAVEMALKNNLEIEIERTGVAAAQQFARGARGAFDPTLRWQPLFESRNTPTSSILFGAEGKLAERMHAQNFGYRQRLPLWGLSLQGDFDNLRQSTSNPFTSLSPFVTSRFSLGVTVPLLRNRLIDRERAEIRVRARQAGVSQIDLELRVIDVVLRVEQSYWDLVAARQDVQVKYDAVNLAREQLARSRRMIDSGTLAPVELAASEAELARRLDTWHASLGVLTEVENSLKALATGGNHETLWSEEIIPLDQQPPESLAIPELRDGVAAALKQRPELKHLAQRQETNQIQQDLGKDQLKPQVNMVAGYSAAGLAGSTSTTENPFSGSNRLLFERVNDLSRRAGLSSIPVVSFGGAPAGLIGGYGSAISDLFTGRYQTFQAGLSIDWNPRNQAAAANLAQTAIAERRLKLERVRVEMAIEVQVRNALQGLETARQRITAADASAQAAREKLESETRLFQNGESTNFLVLTRQNEYADSRRRAVAARLDYNKSLARLEQALGTTLAAHKIRL